MGLKASLTPVIAGWVWISGCEYGINQVWLKSQWEEYFSSIGLSAPQNMMTWALWCLVFAIALRMMVSRVNILGAGLAAWIMVVGMTLITLSQYGPMPTEMFRLYGPASLAETLSAAFLMSLLVSFNVTMARAKDRAAAKAKAKGKLATA